MFYSLFVASFFFVFFLLGFNSFPSVGGGGPVGLLGRTLGIFGVGKRSKAISA